MITKIQFTFYSVVLNHYLFVIFIETLFCLNDSHNSKQKKILPIYLPYRDSFYDIINY